MFPRILTLILCLAGLGLGSLPAQAAPEVKRDLSKDYDDLTPSEDRKSVV